MIKTNKENPPLIVNVFKQMLALVMCDYLSWVFPKPGLVVASVWPDKTVRVDEPVE